MDTFNRAAMTRAHRIGELVDGIPGWDRYEHADETGDELRRVAALLQEATSPLHERTGIETIREFASASAQPPH